MTSLSLPAGGSDSELIRLNLKKSMRIRIRIRIRFFRTATVYLSDDKSQLSSRSLAMRVTVFFKIN